ncbi:hypothetical protein AMCSP19_000103, partial [Streptococcus pneumoniae 2082239]
PAEQPKPEEPAEQPKPEKQMINKLKKTMLVDQKKNIIA